ncbi:1-aminocyclopropane-1-carboxylate oxidase [Channa argus]|uniref:1-aminocyclopropane-1-carboxylate oxidase n=1 Tax=Channa argus TaxID=215402 RepID=A0A6G1QV74_CHAAH|nr:1-aminocyclopropane-1-carboxylate oxidase [Channa argus]
MSIPVVDFSAYGLNEKAATDEQLRALSKELKKALTEVGFVFLKNTGIAEEEVRPADAIKAARRFLKVLQAEYACFIFWVCGVTADENGTTLRSLYYPPVNSEKAKEGQLRCGEHSDYGTITLLFQNSDGLQVRRRSGEFICAPTIPGAVLINVADLMQRWTSDQFVSVLHRVLLPPVGDCSTRQSLAFFVQPDDEALITCCDGSNKYPPVSAGAYLIERFNDSYGRN